MSYSSCSGGKISLGFLALGLVTMLTVGFAAEGWGSILVLIGLIISLVKQLIAFIGFLTFAIKAVIVLAFVALILGVGFAILRSFNKNRAERRS